MLQELQVKTGFAPSEHWIGSTTKHWLHCDLPFFMATIAQCDDRFNDLALIVLGAQTAQSVGLWAKSVMPSLARIGRFPFGGLM